MIDWQWLCECWTLTLLHFLWQGTLVALLLVIGKQCLGQQRPAVRYAMYMVGLWGLLACLMTTLAMIASTGPGQASVGVPSVSTTHRRNGDAFTAVDRASAVGHPLSESDFPVVTDVGSTPVARDAMPTDEQAITVPQHSGSWSRMGVSLFRLSFLRFWAPWVTLLYAIGCAVFLFRNIIGLWGAARLQASAIPVAESALLSEIRLQAKRMQLRSVPVVAATRRVMVPVVVGFFRPVVLVPVEMLSRWSSQQWAAVLAHEFAHIRRWDPIVNLLQRLVESALFFHPAVWWLSRQIRQEREHCCDDLAIDCGQDRLDYVAALLQIASTLIGKDETRQLHALSAAGTDPVELTRRIERLLHVSPQPRLGVPLRALILVTLLLPLGGGTLIAFQKPTDSSANEPSAMSGERDDAGVSANAEQMAFPEEGFLWGRVREGLQAGVKLKTMRKGNATQYRLEFVLRNVTKDQRKVLVRSEGGTGKILLQADHQLRIWYYEGATRTRELTLGPGQLEQSEEDVCSLDLQGLPSGTYQLRCSSFYHLPQPKQGDSQTFRSIPMGVTLPFEITGANQTAPVVKDASPLEKPPAEAREIAWGKSVQGIALGSLLVKPSATKGDEEMVPSSGAYQPGDHVQIQLFAKNTTEKPIDCVLRLPHPGDGWTSNVYLADGGGSNLLRRVYFSGFAIQEGVPLRLPPGKPVPFTSVPVDVFPMASDSGWLAKLEPKVYQNAGKVKGRTLKNASFRIFETLQESMEKGNYGMRQNANLISNGGKYRAEVRAIFHRRESPHVAISTKSGPLPFAVASEDLSSLPTLQRRIVDGETGKPIVGARVTVFPTLPGHDEPKPVVMVTDEAGRFTWKGPNKTPLPFHLEGYFTSRIDLQTTAVTVPGTAAVMTPPAKNMNEVIKAWKGQTIHGRLLYPDGIPAAGQLLNVGTYITSQEWKKKLGMDLTFYSFDHGDWPNWSRRVKTDSDGQFQVTVPPKEAIAWVRVGTSNLSFAAESPSAGKALDNYVPLEVQAGRYAGEYSIGPEPDLDEQGNWILKLKQGVKVYGRVVNANGVGLSDVSLTTEGLHGPHSGRSAVSKEDGRFEFGPVEPGRLVIHPDARLRDEQGKVISRDVQAVFTTQEYVIPDATEPFEVLIRAEGDVELVFDWVDRRTKKSDLISYYGDFQIWGRKVEAAGTKTLWRGEARLEKREDGPKLVVRVPQGLVDCQLGLRNDSVVDSSFEDETGRRVESGRVALDDYETPKRRTIYADDPVETK